MISRKEDYTKEDCIKADLKHLVHGFTDLADWKKSGSSLVIVEGHGMKVKDADGKEYIDACVSNTVNTLGHGRKEIAEVAMAQMSTLEFFDLARGRVHLPIVKLASKLAEVTPTKLKRFYFASSGSEINDTAVKIARRYWLKKGKKDKVKVISRLGSYHGLSIAMTSCTGVDHFWDEWGPLLPEFVHIPGPYCYRCSFGKEYPKCDIECAKALGETIEKLGEDTVAAFIAEPVANGLGCIVPPPEYFPLVRKICSQYNILFIADEVITGFGRTGKWWGMQNWDVEQADMMAIAKGLTSGYLPMGALAMTEDIFTELATPPYQYFSHIFTWSGHPVSAAVATKCIEILQREKLVDHVAELGEHIRHRLAEFKDFQYVGDVRSIGVIGVIEIVADKVTKAKFSQERNPIPALLQEGQQKGFLFSNRGDTISICPPYIATISDVDNIIDNLKLLVTNLKV